MRIIASEKIPGVLLRVLGTNGYQLGFVEAFDTEEGTVEIHPHIFDFASEASLGPLPYTVTREYGELLAIVTDEEAAEPYLPELRKGKRVATLTSLAHMEIINRRLAARRLVAEHQAHRGPEPSCWDWLVSTPSEIEEIKNRNYELTRREWCKAQVSCPPLT